MALLRGREIEGILRNRGFEKGVTYVLTALAEQQIDQRKDMRDLAASVDQMANIINSLVAVGERMKSTVEKLNKEAAHDELGAATQLIGSDDN